MRFFDRPFVVPAVVLAIALIAGLGFVGWGIAARGSQNMISVTGSATTDATADEATWMISINEDTYASDVAAASDRVSQDAQAIADYLSGLQLASSSVSVAAVTTNENYSPDKNTPSGYSVNGSVTVSSSDVHKIDQLSHNIRALNKLVTDGAIVSPQQPQYYLSNLAQLRISLLGAAIKDAKARAEQIAQSGGSQVGALQTASSGVVQVMAPNSTNAEEYGQYDTSTIDKQVTVTVRANFYVR